MKKSLFVFLGVLTFYLCIIQHIVVAEESTVPKESVVAEIAEEPIKEVNNWGEFVTALTTENIQNIKVNASFTATSNVTVIGNKNIDFNNQTLDISGRSITVNTPNTVIVSNLIVGGTTRNSYIFTGNGSVIFNGTLKSSANNIGTIANMPSGSITLDSVEMNYTSGSTTFAAFSSTNFLITNQSNLTVNSQQFFSITTGPRASVKIDKASNINLKSMNNVTDGQIFNIQTAVDFTLDGENTVLDLEGNGSRTADTGGILLIVADGSNINVKNKAKLIAKASRQSVAILLQSKGGFFNVDNYSQVNVTQSGDGGYNLNAAIRFRNQGDMTFNITNHSSINVKKEKGTGGGPAIRMYGGNNAINVSGGSDLIVHNVGTDRYQNGGGDGGNQGIQYRSGNSQANNSFIVNDPNSNVSITADHGPAIDSNSGPSMTIDIGKDAYFVARGATASTTAGIFRSAGVLTFKMDTVKYFDFRNENKGGLFTAPSTAKFNSTSSDISVWTKESDLNSSARYTWSNINFSLSGADLNTLASSSSTTMTSQFGTTDNYSRMSANNQSAIVDELRVPTDADKSLFAHLSIPEGKYDDPRSANNGEASAEFSVINADSSKRYQLVGTTATTSIYGEPEASGWVKVTLPNDEFLNDKETAKVTNAWLGSYKTPAESPRPSTPEDIKTGETKVYGVVPPTPAVVAKKEVELTDSTITGKATPNTTAFLYLNGVDTTIKTDVPNDGLFSLNLPQNLKKDDQLQILLQDKKGKAIGVINPPITNNDIGNIEPQKQMVYHDATFEPGTILSVTGKLSLAQVPSAFAFGTQKIETKTQTIWPTVTGQLKVTDSRGNPEGWQVKVKEIKPLTDEKGNTLSSVLYYQKDSSSQDDVLSSDAVLIYQQSVSQDKEYVISDEWGSDESTGIKMKIPVEKQVIGNYSATLNWSLESVPDNT